jgi:hypothetical protein
MAIDPAKVRQFLGNLVSDGELLKQYVADPHAVVTASKLNGDEKALLLSNNFSQVHHAMSADPHSPSHWVVVWVV